MPEPRIIPRSAHPISRHDIDREALKVMYKLRDAGFSAYLVGGGVRDIFLGKKPKDFDISTDARPGQLRKLFNNSRIIGNRFRLVQVLFRGGKIVEVSTLRCKSEYDINGENEVLQSNNTFGSLEDDAFRRDLTINALFYEIENHTVIDYCGGVEDIQKRIIRIVGDPERRIIRDPVRIMRAIRHASRNDFAIEDITWQAILQHSADLRLCPISRIRDEVFKDFRSGSLAAWARIAIESRIFFEIFPFYEDLLLPATDPPQDPQTPKVTPALEFLLEIFQVIDRLQNDGHKLPDHLLIALFLIPWAQEKMGLMQLDLSGKAHFTFSRQMRYELNLNFNRLSIKRLDKENITSLLVNLPTFIKFSEKSKWPGWFLRKSYFNTGLEFYEIYREATGGDMVTSLNSIRKPEPEHVPDHEPVHVRKKSRSSRHAGRTPAFSNTAGGIFGLKRK
ncbi:MAG: poly(A) polymerase [Proteobacteria bacterium]|nr:poly(A) polymerase [Pseudomonadota bacterium]MBU1709750.1 poly(A) polymerase [Pseudomonadota bacterium]